MSDNDQILAIKKCPMHMPEGWQPPVPGFSANMHADMQVSAVYLGVQRPTPEILWAVNALFAKGGAIEVEYAEFVDRAGDYNRVYITYFEGANTFEDWQAKSDFNAFLDDEQHLKADYGLWVERFHYAPGQYETLFSTPDSLEGVGRYAQDTVGPILEHGYWGGVEDRIPNSSPSKFAAVLKSMPDMVSTITKGKRINVTPPANLCVIRSGQDLLAVKGDERKQYDERIEPALKEGLAFLADNHDTGCFDSRYMRHCTQHGGDIDKTFGMQTFLSIDHMMEWAKTHPTHLKIFHRFQTMAEAMQGQIDIRLWHEVAVIGAGDASAIYINCHEKTGFLPYSHAL